jgi:hemolysin activation/secretion protein
LTLDAIGSARWYAGSEQGWFLTAAAHAFQMSLPAQTLAASLTFDAAFDVQGLAPQLTLGEDNGLRGYPAREFGGSRIVRLNIEDRIRTGIEILSVHVGAAGFFDVGWVHGESQDLSLGEAIKSVGVGLRFGSSELFGRNVGRVDFAWPLDDVNGVSYDLSVSFSAGQVFSFFGNATELRREFQ